MSYTAKVIAVLGRTLRAGRWKLADDSLVIAVFGRCVLDLSRAYVDEDDDELSMTVFCLFGSVSIVLPPGCDVEPSGVALLASSEVEIPSDKLEDITTDVLAPLDISWFAMFGRVRINELSLEPEPEALPAPAVEVFDGGDSATVASTAAATGAMGAATASTPVAPDPAGEAAQAAEAAAEAEQAALRDEIAQWRTETGRPEPQSQPDVDAEIQTEEDNSADSAAGGQPEGAAPEAGEAEALESAEAS